MFSTTIFEALNIGYMYLCQSPISHFQTCLHLPFPMSISLNTSLYVYKRNSAQVEVKSSCQQDRTKPFLPAIRNPMYSFRFSHLRDCETMWGSVKIPCWPACLESLGHRSGWGPHRFTWFGYMVLISVLICKGIPLSWSRSDLVSAWHLGGLRCPWPPSSNASPQRWSSTAQKKKLTAHTPANPPAPFFWKGRATVVCFSFYISSFHIYSRINLAQWLVRTATNRKVPGSSPACGAFAFLFTRGVTS